MSNPIWGDTGNSTQGESPVMTSLNETRASEGKLPSIHTEVVRALCCKHTKSKEHLIKSCLPEGMSLEEVKVRCDVQILGGIETYRLDGVPFLEIHPFEINQEGQTISLTEAYRRWPL